MNDAAEKLAQATIDQKFRDGITVITESRARIVELQEQIKALQLQESEQRSLVDKAITEIKDLIRSQELSTTGIILFDGKFYSYTLNISHYDLVLREVSVRDLSVDAEPPAT